MSDVVGRFRVDREPGLAPTDAAGNRYRGRHRPADRSGGGLGQAALALGLGRQRPSDGSRRGLGQAAFARLSLGLQRRLPGGRPRRGMGHAALAGLSVGVVLVGTTALATTLPRELDISSMPPELPDADGLAADPGPDPERRSSPPSRGESPTRSRAPEPAESPSPAPSPIPAPPPPAGADPIVSFEAEAADLSDAARVVEMADASGGEVVQLAGQDAESEVRFTEVTVEETGVYQLTLFYCSVPEAEGLVAVNQAPPEAVAFPSLEPDAVGVVSLPVELAEGENVITFGIPDGPAPALDRITIAPPAAG